MHWILQSNLQTDYYGGTGDWDKLVEAVQRFELEFTLHKVVPFSGELIPPATPTQDKVICFGTYSMRHTAKAMNWNPGVYDLEQIDFPIQREHWGDDMLNADSLVCRFEDVKIEEPTFLRPSNDTKFFSGKIYDPEEFHEWQHKVVVEKYDYGNSLTNDTMIQVSKPKTIYAEYRYWIVDGEIVTRSLYKRGQRVMYSSDVDPSIDYWVAGRTSNIIGHRLDWLPKAYVFDVAETDNGL